MAIFFPETNHCEVHLETINYFTNFKKNYEKNLVKVGHFLKLLVLLYDHRLRKTDPHGVVSLLPLTVVKKLKSIFENQNETRNLLIS